jgi:UDP-N-acetylmuramate dehydrogenase
MTAPPAGSGLSILENHALKSYTTFKIGGPARYFASARSREQIRKCLALARAEPLPVFVLGGGSNLLVSDRGFSGLVLHPACAGIHVLEEDSGRVRLRVETAEPWDATVSHAVERGWWGIENLSHIPGQSGAALVQNIGAYGQQLSDVFESAEVMEVRTGEVSDLGAEQCDLGYRRSIFNASRKGECIILSITLGLRKRPSPVLGYRDVRAYFEERGIRDPRQVEIRQAIIAIRDLKFPYPREERGGNAGSFFKNPSLSSEEYEVLEAQVKKHFGGSELSRLAEIRKQSGSGGSIRIPAAFLIEICGLKGFEIGRARVNPSQPLVILNLGGATADNVMGLAGHVRRTVFRLTGIRLSLEPGLVGFSREEEAAYLALD